MKINLFPAILLIAFICLTICATARAEDSCFLVPIVQVDSGMAGTKMPRIFVTDGRCTSVKWTSNGDTALMRIVAASTIMAGYKNDVRNAEVPLADLDTEVFKLLGIVPKNNWLKE